ncbi:MAG: glycosyltransferase, partial [Actinomycetota bacterium]|nr:glycosyltransferase [Actinomycetota bacterium]
DALRLDKKDFTVITVAELIKRKNIYDIIAAIASLSDKIRLIIVGNGTLWKELKDYVKNEGLPKKVLFLGRKTDIPELLYISDLFVMTSLHEGLPKAMMEAMAMEKPIVAYNIRGVRDLVVDGKTGFLVPFGDVKSLAEKILFFYEHPDICKEMGKKGREKIEQEFSLNVIMEQMKNLYIEILEA